MIVNRDRSRLFFQYHIVNLRPLKERSKQQFDVDPRYISISRRRGAQPTLDVVRLLYNDVLTRKLDTIGSQTVSQSLSIMFSG